ncbi:MAG: septal ring lytic transglycosylase RlpA family protein [Rhizobiaceae bacterium]
MKTILTASIITASLTVAAIAKQPNIQCGKASWYAMTSLTASGERASPNTMTAAHRTLRFGTKVRVTNLRNGRSVIVRINDRGPFIKGRVIDVTKRAAKKLGFLGAGWTRVAVSPANVKVTKKACHK